MNRRPGEWSGPGQEKKEAWRRERAVARGKKDAETGDSGRGDGRKRRPGLGERIGPGRGARGGEG